MNKRYLKTSQKIAGFSALPKWLILSTALFLLIGCSHQKIEDYQKNSPKLLVENFFNGKLHAMGIVKNRQGKVIRYFSAVIEATWSEGIGTLDERFVFDDGEQQQRIWTLKQQDDGSYLASANDVIGEHKMHIAGNALFMDYILRIPYDDGHINVVVEDKMYLVTEGHIINTSIMRKWGFEVGSIQLSIIKQPTL